MIIYRELKNGYFEYWYKDEWLRLSELADLKHCVVCRATLSTRLRTAIIGESSSWPDMETCLITPVMRGKIQGIRRMIKDETKTNEAIDKNLVLLNSLWQVRI